MPLADAATLDNTLGLPCRAERFIAATTRDDIRAALAMARRDEVPLNIVGGASNLVLAPTLPGVTLQVACDDWWWEAGDDQTILVYAQAGLSWHDLVTACVERGWWGIENLALIPGHVGAAPIQNIGAYGVELADVLEAVHVMYCDDGRDAVFSRDECEFAYRDSLFKRALAGRVVVTQVVLRLSRRPAPRMGYGDLAERVALHPEVRAIFDAVCAVRREKLPDPAVLGNAGSFFTNPVLEATHAGRLLQEYPAMPHFPQPNGRVKLAAGWLIERCGFKGTRWGAFGVHERQALVLVHFGGGDRQALLALADHIRDTVQQTFGVMLEREPRLMG
ncbi:UDP-N-acetylmuramate dehydrogenase [Chromohalobacter marismortui]|uniref:UDP-N-acetylenolpyruvoylglucosamine reductase n=1 Tax=Chromohalobacter marismortui TaxID=42055 RepID=A0A4R7NWI8_9GAMM|nr:MULTISPECIES: UDP-N-acetylmuramate dehydrogenase [Chromohalobacter]MCI0510383.1 UDP-N-acetylmuramate dehydrogenase [Chromohalobacter sp.]MCI0594732.1 UDP-N-acetylmuramate dehydrogenase [Chromohalobacter sp.]TDU25041.1 UDP-N-acetylmuramate dehydrogenase [Chromohalobacter marismortui]